MVQTSTVETFTHKSLQTLVTVGTIRTIGPDVSGFEASEADSTGVTFLFFHDKGDYLVYLYDDLLC